LEDAASSAARFSRTVLRIQTMKADFRLLRRSALGVCGAALLGFSLGGCVSTHKPRFWDQNDVKNGPDAGSTQTLAASSGAASATDATAAKAAPTVVAADHTTTTDSSGHVEAFDFADATSPASTPKNAAASDSQPAPPDSANGGAAPSAPPKSLADSFDELNSPAPAPKKPDSAPTATDSFGDSASSPPAVPSLPSAPPTPALPGAISHESSAAAVVPPSSGTRSADPFGDTDNPVFVGKSQGQPTVPAAPSPSPASQDTFAAPQQASIQSQPALPASPQPTDLVQPAAPDSSPPQSPQTGVAVNDSHHGGADPFAETQPSAAPTSPAAPVAAMPSNPSCAAPMPNVPPAATQSLPAPPAGPATKQPAAPLVQIPSRAPASTEQASEFDNEITVPPGSKIVVPTSKSTVAAKPEASVAKPAIREASIADGKEPEWSSADHAERSPGASDAMILDSGTVRGRFVGGERMKAKASHPSAAPKLPAAPSEKPKQLAPELDVAPSQPAAVPKQPVTQPSPPVAAPPAPPTDNIPNLDAEGPVAPAAPANLPAVGQTSHEPDHKPLSGVVNAVAQQVSPATVADPFALEQTDETGAAQPAKSRQPHALASVNAAQELDPFGEPSPLAASQAPSAESTAVAPLPAHVWLGIQSQMGFIIGLTVGLSAGLLVWLRSRLRKAHVTNN
jgi:hypothetical protein